jgi:hypothetical protein
MAVVSVDLGCKPHSDNGVVVLGQEQGIIVAKCMELRETGRHRLATCRQRTTALNIPGAANESLARQRKPDSRSCHNHKREGVLLGAIGLCAQACCFFPEIRIENKTR